VRDLFCRLWGGESGLSRANLGRLGVRGRPLCVLAMDVVVDVRTVERGGFYFLIVAGVDRN